MQNKNKLKFLKENYQVIYSIILIIFIPSAIIANTVIFAKDFKKVIDREMHAKAIDLINVINADMIEIVHQPEELQKRVNLIHKFNNNISSLDILGRKNEKFDVVASLDEKMLGKTSEDIENAIAWNENQPVAYLTNSSVKSNVDKETSFIKENGRFWVVIMPMKDKKGEKIGLISLKLSLAEMDAMTQSTLVKSYVILLITVLIIILLLANNTRLFEYATLYKKIKEVDQMKDEFISMASHELRTPVTGIRGYVSMALDGTFGELNDKLRNSLKIVNSSAERLAILVEDLLNVSRIEQGRMKVQLQPIEAGGIIRSVVEELKIQADAKSLSLEYSPHDQALPLVNIDTDRFKQVMINLIGNAIKYTPKGEVEILTDIKNEKELEIKIKDTGIGMSAKARERLFEKFYRVENDKTKEITGTGLGLWITKQLVEMMKGQILVDSIEDVGTQITLIFPLQKNN